MNRAILDTAVPGIVGLMTPCFPPVNRACVAPTESTPGLSVNDSSQDVSALVISEPKSRLTVIGFSSESL